MRGRNTKEQQQTVAQVLLGLLPPQAPARFRRWFPLNKVRPRSRRWNASAGSEERQAGGAAHYLQRTYQALAGLPLLTPC